VYTGADFTILRAVIFDVDGTPAHIHGIPTTPLEQASAGRPADLSMHIAAAAHSCR